MAKKSNRPKRRKSIGKRISGAFNGLTDGIEKFFKSVFGSLGSGASFLGSLFIPKSLTKKMDRATKSTGKSVGRQVGAITEQVEKKFSKGASGFFGSFGFLLKILLPKPLLDAFGKISKRLSRTIRRFFSGMGKFLGGLAQRFLPKWLVAAFARLSKRTRHARRATSKFVTAWWKSRNMVSLAWATPAFLLAIPLLVGSVGSLAYTSSSKIGHYQRVMYTALEEKEFDKADLFRQKLSQLGYRRMERIEFSSALGLAEDGNMQAAYDKMKEIAQLDPPGPAGNGEATNAATTIAAETEPGVAASTTPNDDVAAAAESEAEAEEDLGYAPAHLWLAVALFNDEVEPEAGQDKMDLIWAHTQAALAIEPKNVYARYLRFKHKQTTDSIDWSKPEERDEVADLASDFPQVNGELVPIYSSLGEQVKARSCAGKYVNYIDSVGEEALSAVEYEAWAVALNIRGDFEGANRVARLGAQRFPDHPATRRIGAAAVLAKLAEVDQDSPEALTLLCEVHRLDPDNLAVARRIANRLVYDTVPTETALQPLSDANEVSSAVYLMAGEFHVQRGRLPEGEALFRKAIAVNPEDSQAFNNLAWVLANSPRKRMSEAFQNANRAVELAGKADYYETRGQILYAMDNLLGAAEDLERALYGVLPAADQKNSHGVLAKIYRQLGNPEKAAAHEARAAAMR